MLGRCKAGCDTAPSLTVLRVSVGAGRARAGLTPVGSRIQMRSVVRSQAEDSAAMGNSHGFLGTVSATSLAQMAISSKRAGIATALGSC